MASYVRYRMFKCKFGYQCLSFEKLYCILPIAEDSELRRDLPSNSHDPDCGITEECKNIRRTGEQNESFPVLAAARLEDGTAKR